MSINEEVSQAPDPQTTSTANQMMNSGQRWNEYTNYARLVILVAVGLYMIFIWITFIILTSQDPDQYRSIIEKYASDTFEGTLEMGTMSWRVWPVIGLESDHLLVKENQGETLASADNIFFHLSMRSLWSEDKFFNGITINNPHITIDFDLRRSNWETFLEPRINQTVRIPQSQHMNKQSLEIEDGMLRVSSPWGQMLISDVQFFIDDFEQSRKSLFSGEGSFTILDDHTDTATASTVTTGEFELNGFAQLEPGRLNIGTATLEGRINALPKKYNQFSIASEGYYAFSTKTLHLEPVVISQDRSQLTATLLVETNQFGTEVLLTLPEQRPKLGSFFRYWIPPHQFYNRVLKMADSIAVGGKIISTKDSLTLALTTFHIDKHPGRLGIDINKRNSKVTSTIQFAYFDLKSLLESQPGRELKLLSKSSSEAAPSNDEDFQIPVETLRDLNLTLNLKIGELVLPSYNLLNLDMITRVDAGVVNVDSATFSAFNGDITADARLDLRQDTPQLTLNQSSERLDASKLTEWLGASPWITGLIDNKLTATSSGTSWPALLANSQGTFDILMRNGEMPHFNIHALAYQNLNLLAGAVSQTQRASFKKGSSVLPQSTQIKNLYGNMQFTPERLTSDSTVMTLNQEFVHGEVNYDRMENLLEFAVDVTLESSDPMLSAMKWPVFCFIKNHGQPMCGVNSKKLQARAVEILGK